MGSGRKGHLGDVGPHCPKCNGVGFMKPTQAGGLGMPMYGAAPAMPGPVGPLGPGPVGPHDAYPPTMGGYGANPGVPPTYIPTSY